eukprot:12283490-Alexandrium_andersonii.AAC.1
MMADDEGGRLRGLTDDHQDITTLRANPALEREFEQAGAYLKDSWTRMTKVWECGGSAAWLGGFHTARDLDWMAERTSPGSSTRLRRFPRAPSWAAGA